MKRHGNGEQFCFLKTPFDGKVSANCLTNPVT
jgi:hypothetical protein